MIDFASCLSVSDAPCSSSSSSSKSFLAPVVPSTQTSVSCVYRTRFSTDKHMLIAVTWSSNASFPGLSVAFGEEKSNSFKLDTGSRFFRRLRGGKVIEFQSCAVEIFWDLSSARFLAGPEPVGGYYILITVDSEIALVLGDVGEEFAAAKIGLRTPDFSLVKRQEQFLGRTQCSTRAKFCEKGGVHDISIRCRAEDEGLSHPELCVCVDDRTVIRVKKLRWSFRGNQTVVLDGLVVDFMWDVHDWLHNPFPGTGVFMFRTRSGLDSKLWLEEETVQNYERVEFALMICACKNIV